jgi:P-type conjugative transfer protein TrbJ
MRKQVLVWTLSSAIGLGPVIAPQPAFAGGPFPFATEYTQLLNYATLVHQYAQQIQMVTNTFHQYQQMLYNAKNLAQFPLTAVQTDLTKLFNISQGSFGVAYSMSQLDQQFSNIYKSYSSTSGTPYYKAYGSWRSGTLAAIQNAIAAAGMQPSMINNEQSVLSVIKSLMQTPQGQEQSVQLGYTISLEMNNQLEKLRTLMASDLQSKAAFSAYQVQKDAARTDAVQDVLQHIDYGSDPRTY